MQLLRAAAELLGGNAALAQRLRVREGLLVKFMAGRYPLPPQLRLITVDLLLEAREARRPPPAVDGDPPARDSAP